MSDHEAIYPRNYVQGLFDETVRLSRELSDMQLREQELVEKLRETLLNKNKIIEDYSFKFHDMQLKQKEGLESLSFIYGQTDFTVSNDLELNVAFKAIKKALGAKE